MLFPELNRMLVVTCLYLWEKKEKMNYVIIIMVSVVLLTNRSNIYSIYRFVGLSVCGIVCLSVCQFVKLSVFWTECMSVCLSFALYVGLSVRLSIRSSGYEDRYKLQIFISYLRFWCRSAYRKRQFILINYWFLIKFNKKK